MAKAPPEKRTPPPPPRARALGLRRGDEDEKPTRAPRGEAEAKPDSRKAKTPERESRARAPEKPVIERPAPAGKPRKPQPAFPKKNQPPTAAAFAARLPLALGKRFDFARAFLAKQPDVREDVYFYGPESGWALRYLLGERPLCSLHIYDEQPIAIVSLDPGANAGIDWRAISPVAQKARKQAHGSPTLLWLDLPLEGTGANDFKSILRAKLAAQSTDGEGVGNEGSDVDG